MSEEQQSMEQAAIHSIALDRSTRLLSELGSLVLSDEIKEDISDKLPILKYRGIYKSIRDAFFFNKFCKFLEGVSQVPLEARENFVRDRPDDELKQDGNYLINYIDRLDDEAKPKLAGGLYSKYILGLISKDELLRFNYILNNIFVLDLLELKDSLTSGNTIDKELAQRIAPLGITAYKVEDDPYQQEYLSRLGSGRGSRPPSRQFQTKITTSFTQMGVRFVRMIFDLETDDK